MVVTHEAREPGDAAERLRGIREQEEHVRIVEGEVDDAREALKHRRAALQEAQRELGRLIRGDRGLPFPNGDVAPAVACEDKPASMGEFRKRVDTIAEGAKRGRNHGKKG